MEQVLIALQWHCKFCAFSCLLQGAILKEAQFFNGATVACGCGSGLSKNNAVHCGTILGISWIWILTIVSTFLAQNVFYQGTICTKWWYCRSRKSVQFCIFHENQLALMRGQIEAYLMKGILLSLHLLNPSFRGCPLSRNPATGVPLGWLPIGDHPDCWLAFYQRSFPSMNWSCWQANCLVQVHCFMP